MKVLCPQCHQPGDLEHFRIEGNSLIVTCRHCGATSRSDARPSAEGTPATTTPIPASAPLSSEVAPRPSSPSHPRLTLTSAPDASNVVSIRTADAEAISHAARSTKGDPFEVPQGACPKCVSPRAEETLSCPFCGLSFAHYDPSAFMPSEWLQEQWLGLLQSWGDETKHEALLTKALSQGELAGVGRLYRVRLATLPNDPIAERGRQEVLRLVTAPVAVRAQARRMVRTSTKVVLGVVAATLALAGAAYVLLSSLPQPGR